MSGWESEMKPDDVKREKQKRLRRSQSKKRRKVVRAKNGHFKEKRNERFRY